MSLKGSRITDRHRQVIDYVNGYIVEHGRRPTRREIADHLGLGPKSLGHITRLLGQMSTWREVDYLRAKVRELEEQLAGRAAA
ncbi:LexA family protein [Dongia sp.]|uniref:LexA family protein n=1 Tax=Dongia sp. TaxID=1977262 RepID=UPI0035AFB0D4